MAEILDDVAYLSQEIGPRPAGTEEEQQAALFIADQVHKRTNLQAEIEDIQCNANAWLVDLIYFGVAFLAVVLSIALPVIGVAMFIVSLLCTACFLCEERYHRPLLSRLLSRDVSQNVVVKYRPEAAAKSGSRRKIIVVANYDSGKVKNDLKPGLLKAWSILGHAADIAMIAAPVVLFFKSIVFANALGFVSGFFTLLAIVVAVLVAVPAVRAVLHHVGAYNEAANANASGVAVLLNLMHRASGDATVNPLQQEEQEEAEQESDAPVIHGAAAAQEAGVIPEGSEVVYDEDNGETANDQVEPVETEPEVPSDEPAAAVMPADEPRSDAAEEASPEMPQQNDDSDGGQAPVSGSDTDTPSETLDADADNENSQAAADAAVQHSEPNEADSDSDVATEDDAQEVREVIEPEPAAAPVTDDYPDESGESPAERLRAAKAAIAALTGQPVDDNIYAQNISDEPVNMHPEPIRVPDEKGQERMRSDMMSALGGSREEVNAPEQPDYDQIQPADNVEARPNGEQSSAPIQDDADMHAPIAAEPTAQPQSEPSVVRKPEVPDWYRSAQEKAKRSDRRTGAVHRSRYADALDSAVRESSVFFKQANQLVDEETETRLHNMRQGIAEVKAPHIASDTLQQDSAPVAESASREDVRTTPQPEVLTSNATPVQADSPVVQAPSRQEPVSPVRSDQAPVSETVASSDYPSESTRSRQIESDAITASKPPAREMPVSRSSISPVADEGPVSTVIPPINIDREADQQESENHKVLPDDPALGRTIAMKPIQMPVSNAAHPQQHPSSDGRSSERRAPQPVRPRVKLPEVPSANMAPIADTAKQRAPLAQATEVDGQAAAKSLLSHTIPKIDVNSLSGDLGKPVQDADESTESKRQNLIEHLPSLSSSVTSESPESAPVNDKVVSATGSFTAVSATGTFAPVGDELVADVAPEDRYIDDADDSVEAGGVTESGAFAGPDYVNMPKTRRSRFFSHFHRKNKKKQEEESPQEWLDVEDDFDARTVGRERGDWDSFQEGDARAHTADRQHDNLTADAPFEGYEEYDANDGEVPNQGYSQGVVYEAEITYENPVSRPMGNDAADYSIDSDIIDEEPVEQSAEPLSQEEARDRRWQGGAFSGNRSTASGTEHADDFEEAYHIAAQQASHRSAQFEREVRDIYEFADDALNTEVWFVALGAQEESDNAGMKSFLETHAEELRGAIVVSIESMGAGTLGFGNQEGVFKHYAPSTRVKRFLHTASQDTGINLAKSDQSWRSTAASVAMAHGLQAVSLMGLDGDKPAFYAQRDDVLENIDEELVRQNAGFLWQFLKAI